MRRHRDGRAFVHVSKATADLIAGEVDIADWDDEELMRGYSRAKDGSLRGRPPSVVPISVYQEFVRRQLRRAEQGFVENVAAATEALADVATDPLVEPETRLKAIGMILDRVYGKPKQRVDIAGVNAEDGPWRQVLESVVIERDIALEPGGDEDVVDAEIVEENDDDYTFD